MRERGRFGQAVTRSLGQAGLERSGEARLRRRRGNRKEAVSAGGDRRPIQAHGAGLGRHLPCDGGTGHRLRDHSLPVPAKSDLPDGRPDIADVLYGIHRSTHGHDDELPKGFELTRHGSRDAKISIWRDGRIQLPAASVLGLLAIAVFSPENKGEVVPINYKLSWYQHDFQISAWWGWQDHFRDIVGSAKFSELKLDFDDRWDD